MQNNNDGNSESSKPIIIDIPIDLINYKMMIYFPILFAFLTTMGVVVFTDSSFITYGLLLCIIVLIPIYIFTRTNSIISIDYYNVG